MPDEVYVYRFCGNCHWYDVDKDYQASGWVQNVNAKHHVLKYATNINLDKRIETNVRY